MNKFSFAAPKEGGEMGRLAGLMKDFNYVNAP
jgi:hypothetical protein